MASAQPVVIARAGGFAGKRAIGRAPDDAELAARVLLQLRALAEDALGETITDAVVAVPAHFDDAQRQAMRDAARLAGFDVLRLVNEPTAAALAYSAGASASVQRVAACVLDEGSFDVSIVELRGGVIRVCATAGDAIAGGAAAAALALCRAALSDAGLIAGAIDEVLLVGAADDASVRAALTALFGRAPSAHIDPDAAVAIGAAREAGVLTGEVQEVLVFEVVPLSLGIETAGGVFTRLIPRNTALPARATAVFSTTLDNQSAVDIHVLQGEREMAADNSSLAHFELTGIPPAPRGAPKIEVAFELDAAGVLGVSARDTDAGPATGVTVAVRSLGALSEGDVQHLVNESLEMAPADQRRRAFAEARNRGEGLLYSSEKAMEEFRGVLSDDERELLAAELAACRIALDRDDLAAVEDAVARLEAAARQLGEAIDAAADPLPDPLPETSGT